jgi:hypothetical protein
MNKAINYLAGPELLWMIFYAVVIVIIKATHSPIKSMDSFWVNTGFIVPLVLVPLTFALYFIPGVSHNWLLLRIWIAVLIGGNFVLSKSLSVHSEGGPGVGTVYMMGMAFVIVVLIAGSIFVWLKFR